MSDWKIFQGDQSSAEEKLNQLLSVKPPEWRQFVNPDLPLPWDATLDTQYWNDLRNLAAQKTRDIRRGERFRLRVQPPIAAGEVAGSTKAKNPYSQVIEAVNAALYLRRPLMITGRPGSGKTSLAYAIACELNLGPVLLWPITARSILQDGLYEYDAIARLQDAQLLEQMMKVGDSQKEDLEQFASDFKKIGKYIRLGPVGTAFLPSKYPRVLLIDEIDKSDINLPNELLNLFEEGEYTVSELQRLSKSGKNQHNVETDDDLTVKLAGGVVRCGAFPIVIMTSNGERDFPPAFYRRCLRVDMPDPSREALEAIVEAHLGTENMRQFDDAITAFTTAQDSDESPSLPTDQLLNFIYLLANQHPAATQDFSKSTLKKLLFSPLGSTEVDREGDVDLL